MKFIKKRNRYEAPNVTCNLETMQAFSFTWWLFLTVHNGKVIFNNYGYSNSTRKHQSKVLKLLEEQGITVDLFISTAIGLDGAYRGYHGDDIDNVIGINRAFLDAIRQLKLELDSTRDMLNNPRRKKALDDTRLLKMGEIRAKIQEIEEVMHGSKLGAVTA